MQCGRPTCRECESAQSADEPGAGYVGRRVMLSSSGNRVSLPRFEPILTPDFKIAPRSPKDRKNIARIVRPRRFPRSGEPSDSREIGSRTAVEGEGGPGFCAIAKLMLRPRLQTESSELPMMEMRNEAAQPSGRRPRLLSSPLPPFGAPPVERRQAPPLSGWPRTSPGAHCSERPARMFASTESLSPLNHARRAATPNRR